MFSLSVKITSIKSTAPENDMTSKHFSSSASLPIFIFTFDEHNVIFGPPLLVGESLYLLPLIGLEPLREITQKP